MGYLANLNSVNQASLSAFIWSVADLLRGDYKQSKYGKVILPFAVLRRLDLMESGGGSVQEKEKARLEEIIAKVNDLFEGELTEYDRLVYVNNVIKGKLLESVVLVQQAVNNTKEQFASSPDLSSELLNAIMDALAAHNAMSKQALESERVRNGLREILLGPGQLYEALRSRAEMAKGQTAP